ncbi:Phospholipid/glycerol acyltransferase, partial [Sporodiniella umbellata]
GLNSFLHLLQDTQRIRGVITVSNHKSTLDDPFLWGVLPIRTLFTPTQMRWVMGAADICYTSGLKSYFFAFGQTIPTIRGGGIYQPGVDYAIHILNQGAWVHMYPEAKVNQTDKMIRFKWGVGRLVMEAEKEPIVIPIWHQGMELAKPLYDPIIHLNK